MPVGPLARLLSQIVVVVGGAVARALIQAYKDAAVRGIQSGNLQQTLRRRMTVDEASKILEVDPMKTTINEVTKRYQRLHDLNTPTPTFGGSPYLQKKVENAYTVIEEDIYKFTNSSKNQEKNTSSKSDSHIQNIYAKPSMTLFQTLGYVNPLKYYPFHRVAILSHTTQTHSSVHPSLLAVGLLSITAIHYNSMNHLTPAP